MSALNALAELGGLSRGGTDGRSAGFRQLIENLKGLRVQEATQERVWSTVHHLGLSGAEVLPRSSIAAQIGGAQTSNSHGNLASNLVYPRPGTEPDIAVGQTAPGRR